MADLAHFINERYRGKTVEHGCVYRIGSGTGGRTSTSWFFSPVELPTQILRWPKEEKVKNANYPFVILILKEVLFLIKLNTVCVLYQYLA